MKIVEVTIGITDSVKLAPYEYAKPELHMTVQVDEGEDPQQIIEQVTDGLIEDLGLMKAKIKADYDERNA